MEFQFLIIVIVAAAEAFVMFITWALTKLFNIDFFIAYQILTFLACLFANNDKK